MRQRAMVEEGLRVARSGGFILNPVNFVLLVVFKKIDREPRLRVSVFHGQGGLS